jgi:hypothetical protein
LLRFVDGWRALGLCGYLLGCCSQLWQSGMKLLADLLQFLETVA